MSKGSDSPAASSFSNPRKTGWLHKHGGSGVSSHWKRRYFVMDHQYLFYYKGPNDKKPVGILSLSDYASCHRVDPKEWKKPHSFMLDKGSSKNSDATDGPVKSYVLYSESEKETEEWIKALAEEVKPGGRTHGISNGNPPRSKQGSKQGRVKFDEKAMDEVSEAAAAGPKLVHITVERPRMKNRRPPKRYATYHEEDTKEESPPSSPKEERKPSPTVSPSASPPGRKEKGHRPSVPLKPKPRANTNAKALEENGTAVENDTTRVPPDTPKKPKPPPPKKPSAKDVLAAPMELDEVNRSPEPATRPSPASRPIPPKKPPKEVPSERSPDQSPTERPEPADGKEPAKTTAPLPRKPRPIPPVKPRSATSASSIEAPPSPTPVPTTPDRPTVAPRPVPRKRVKSSVTLLEEAVSEEKEDTIKETEDAEVSETPAEPREEIKPLAAAEVVEQPPPEKVTQHEPSVHENIEAEPKEGDGKGREGDVSNAPEKTEEAVIENHEGINEPMRKEYVNLSVLPDRPEGKAREVVPVPGPEHEPSVYENFEVEAKKGESKDKEEDVAEKTEVAVSEDKEDIDEPIRKEYVNLSVLPDNLEGKGRENIPDPKASAAEAKVTEQPPDRPPPPKDITEEILSPGYEHMDPRSPLKPPTSPERPQEPLSPEVYEAMKSGVLIDKPAAEVASATKEGPPEYENPGVWRPPSAEGKASQSPHNSDEEADEYELPPDAHTDYDFPSSMHRESTSIYDVPRPLSKSPEPLPPVQRSSASTPASEKAAVEEGLFDLEPDEIQEVVIQAGSRTSSSSGGSTSQRPQKMEKDMFGYTKVQKHFDRTQTQISRSSTDSEVEDKSATGWAMADREQRLESPLDTIPATLQQAREILRLARVVKAEAEETKREAQRELELARREKQDAEILKKNAAEILRMAKERLHAAPKH